MNLTQALRAMYRLFHRSWHRTPAPERGSRLANSGVGGEVASAWTELKAEFPVAERSHEYFGLLHFEGQKPLRLKGEHGTPGASSRDRV
jgi:hypothetical protein